MAAIGDVFWKLAIESAGLAAEMERTVGKAADKAAPSIGKRITAGIKSALPSAIGAGAGLLFTAAAKGANELAEAMATFRAETGATQEEVESAQKSVVNLSRTNLQSFAEIAAVQAKLRTDLGLTQEAAEDATEAFLDYGTATGRDAAEGVSALDDILDAWNLDASKGAEIMDKLVKSHQKYGGSITENERQLSVLAPQLAALNVDIDDGIALLNLFAASGLDSAKAAFALNTAVRNLKPGQDLNDLIAQIASIEDPTLRAQKAIEIFGARGGVSLANVLRPGVDSLDDFAIGMDEAAGATKEAADAIEATPFNQLKLALRGLIAPLAEFGTAFGPLILGFSTLGGGKLLAVVASGIGAVATNLIGLKVATLAMLGPLGLFIAAVGAAAVALDAFTSDTDRFGEGLIDLEDKLVGQVDRTKEHMKDALKDDDSLVTAAQQVGEDVGTGMTEGLADGLRGVVGKVETALGEASEVAGMKASEVAGSVADGLESRRTGIESAIDKMVDAIDNGLTTAQEIARFRRIGRQIRDDLESDKPEVRARAQEVAEMVNEGLTSLGEEPFDFGESIPKSIKAGMSATEQVVKNAADAIALAIKMALGTLPSAAYGWGVSIGRETARGITDGAPKITTTRPTATSPARVTARQSGGPLDALQPALVGERGPELFVPRVPGMVVPNDLLRALQTQASPPERPLHVHLTAAPAARDPFAVADQLVRIERLGVR